MVSDVVLGIVLLFLAIYMMALFAQCLCDTFTTE